MSPDRRPNGRSSALTLRGGAGRTAAMTPTHAVQPSGATMWDFMSITKALADENRVRMLLALRGQELCLCQIVELVVLAPSTASKHMSILRQARLVEGRKSGRWMYYRLASKDAPEVVQQALAWAMESLASDPRVVRDAERLQEILQLDAQSLCESQCPPERSCGKSGKNSRRP